MTGKNKPSLKEYWNMLNAHDWFYDYSEDHSVWCAGHANDVKIKSVANRGPEYEELYQSFRTYKRSDQSSGIEKPPQPE